MSAIAESATAAFSAMFHESSLPGQRERVLQLADLAGRIGRERQRMHEPDEDDGDVDRDPEPEPPAPLRRDELTVREEHERQEQGEVEERGEPAAEPQPE